MVTKIEKSAKIPNSKNICIEKKKSICYNFFKLTNERKEEKSLEFLALLIILTTLILILLLIAIYQIKAAGMKVKDFWTFIKANDTLDKLYEFSAKYKKLSPQQQIMFLQEAELIFAAFDKVPNALWEDEYNKYMEILNKYKDIKILRWQQSSK